MTASRFALWLLIACGWGCETAAPPDATADATLDTGAPDDVRRDDDARSADAPIDAPPSCDPRRRASCETGGFASFPVALPAALSARGEVVDDARAALTWQRSTDAIRRSLLDALTYCDALSLEGESDFRLPTRIELISLIVLGRSPTLDPLFTAEPEYHWTQSLPGAFGGASAFSVYFGAGDVAYALASRPTGLVRCVAGEPTVITDRFSVAVDGVRDAGTGLVWSSEVLLDVPHAEIASRCAGLSLRVPTLLELASIVDESRSDPAVHPVFGATPSTPHWTASEDALGPRVVDFLHGEAIARDPSESHALRCVR